MLITPGGGGYGDPKKRALELIAEDLKEGFITPEAAEKDYGLDPERIKEILSS